MRTLPEVGQVWESRDVRDAGKRIEVTEAEPGFYGFLRAVTVHHPERPWLVGRKTRIAMACMNDYYRLVPPSEQT